MNSLTREELKAFVDAILKFYECVVGYHSDERQELYDAAQSLSDQLDKDETII